MNNRILLEDCAIEDAAGPDFLRDNTRNVTTIPTVSRLPRSVETTAKNIENNFTMTSQALLATAVHLENRARDLREKAEIIAKWIDLSADLRAAVNYEREAYDEVVSLSLVAVNQREDN